jgi:putative endonuclease
MFKNWIYIGCTSNLTKRLQEHQLGKRYSTKKYVPLRLVYYEAYFSKEDAYAREQKLKQYGSSLQKLRQRLTNSLKSSPQKGRVKGGAG